jgi:hypothetical protein
MSGSCVAESFLPDELQHPVHRQERLQLREFRPRGTFFYAE